MGNRVDMGVQALQVKLDPRRSIPLKGWTRMEVSDEPDECEMDQRAVPHQGPASRYLPQWARNL